MHQFLDFVKALLRSIASKTSRSVKAAETTAKHVSYLGVSRAKKIIFEMVYERGNDLLRI